MTTIVRILRADGSVVVDCADRKTLLENPRYQCALAEASREQLYCGCCGTPLRLCLACEGERMVPRAWFGEAALHPPTCGAVGHAESDGGGAGEGAKDKTLVGIIEDCLTAAYARQFSEENPNQGKFCRWVTELLSAELARHDVNLFCRVSLTRNTTTDKNDGPACVYFDVLDYTEFEWGQEGRWRIPVDAPRSGRVRPDGSSLLGLHVLIYIACKDPRNLLAFHAWPAEFVGGRLHPVHSDSCERKMLHFLHDAGVDMLKLPNERFLGDFADPRWAGLRDMLAGMKIWPDVAARLRDGKFCLVEGAGMDTPEYRLGLLGKIPRLRVLEDQHGLQWVIVRPDGDRFILEYRSHVCELAGLFANR
jgi:hypothetical protein